MAYLNAGKNCSIQTLSKKVSLENRHWWVTLSKYKLVDNPPNSAANLENVPGLKMKNST